MDRREQIRSMLTNLINDRHEEATADMHDIIQQKMRDVSGIVPAETAIPELDIDDEIDTADSDDITTDTE